MKSGLNPVQWQSLHDIFRSEPAVESAILFGSRALGTFREASDIDIAVRGGGVHEKVIARLRDAFEESDLPYFVDVVHYEKIDHPPFKEHIDGHGVVFYRKDPTSASAG